MNRGDRREKIFEEDEDRHRFFEQSGAMPARKQAGRSTPIA
jgi:hypothetical protein